MEKKNDNFSFENSTNEKQNSLSSRIRIGLGGGSLTLKPLTMEKIKTLRKWDIRLAVTFVASQVTGVGIWYCLAGYFVFMFLFQFFLRLFLSLTGLVVMVILILTLFVGLLTL